VSGDAQHVCASGFGAWILIRFSVVSVIVGGCFLWGGASFLRAADPDTQGIVSQKPTAKQTTPSPADTRRKQIDTLLHSGNADQIQQAFTDMKAWLGEDPKVAEMNFWRLRASFLLQTSRISDVLDLIDLGLQAKAVGPKTDPHVGYLYVLQGTCFFTQGKQDDGIAAVKKGLSLDQRGAAAEILTTLPKVLTASKSYDQLLTLLTQVALAAPDDPKVVEPALKQSIATLNLQNKYDQALSVAKSLFNVSTMAHTADALTILDRQLALTNITDRSIVDKFRKEENDGATPPVNGEAPQTSATLAAIKVDATPYEAQLESATDDSFAAVLQHASLLLLADRPNDALTLAKRAYAQAGKAKEISAATDMIARCFKAQDGTIGRANGWISGAQGANDAPATQSAVGK
jgi:hypothetical protein